MSEIKGLISELGDITTEIKRLNTQRRKLNARKKQIESVIVNFLEKNNEIGVKYRGTAIVAKASSRRGRRKKKDKEEDGKAVLRKYGINNGDIIAKEFIEAIKGEKKGDTILKISLYD